MKKSEFINTAKKLVNTPTKYKLGGIGQLENDKFLFDCIGLIKSIIWGFDFSYTKPYGGAVYKSNGLDDVGANKFFEEYCYDKSSNFSIIEPGEIVWLDGHVGINVGDLRVVEATSDWDNKVILSSIDYEGRRTYNYTQILKWQKHGKCKLIDYSNNKYKYNNGTNVILNGYLHKDNKTNSECLGEFHDYLWTITNIKDGEYPYELNKIGWCRENYIKPYNK